MKKSAFILLTILISTFSAMDSFAEDCSLKDNLLQSLSTDYYHFIHFKAKDNVVLSDEKSTILLKKGESVSVSHTKVENESLLVFEITTQDSNQKLPSIIFNPQDPFEATISDLEKDGLFEVTCSVILPEEHSSQLGRWAYEYKLRKPVSKN